MPAGTIQWSCRWKDITPEVDWLFSSLRKGASPLIHDAIFVLRTASTILLPRAGKDAFFWPPRQFTALSDPKDPYHKPFSSFPRFSKPCKSFFMESSRNYGRFGNRPFLDDLTDYAQWQSWYPYRFLLVWEKTCRNDKSSRARTLYSSYKKGCTFLPLKRPLPFALPNHSLGKKEY